MKESVTISSTAFYNHIAEDYNAQMNQDPHNERIRTETAGYLKSILRQGVVLDFGGGTGLDLPWLLQHNYKVIFCEPAPNMRMKAVNFVKTHHATSDITFLDDHQVSDLSPSNLNMEIDAVLANFAVLNCIADLEEVFHKLALIMKHGGHLIANIIDTRLPVLIKKFPKSYLKSIFTGEIITVSGGSNLVHKTYLHRLADIKKISSPFFTLEHSRAMHGFGFLMIHLKRK